MIVPVHLVPLYPYPQDVRLFTAPFLLSISFILAIALSCRIGWKWRKSRGPWAYYAITILPVIGLIPGRVQAMADRYAYLPSLGPFVSMGLFAAWTSHTMSNIASPSRKKTVGLLVTSAAAAVLLILSHLTLTEIAIWKDSLTLWTYELSAQRTGILLPIIIAALRIRRMSGMQRLSVITARRSPLIPVIMSVLTIGPRYTMHSISLSLQSGIILSHLP